MQLKNDLKASAIVRFRKYWWQFWLPKTVWIVDDNNVLRLYDPIKDRDLGKPGFESIYYRGEPLGAKAGGRVVKAKSRPEYDPTPRTGGRVRKTMPRQLRKIKEGQEATDDPS